ncbi:hypothetical protein IWW49_002881 [Coemansia sp. RSA 1797]|nr:hypothetical protein IWW49_002881 [Coemansia sp. RSA 1797]
MQEVIRGLFRGAKRGVMTSKQGRNFYKASFVILAGCELKPYVSHSSDKFKVDPPTATDFSTQNIFNQE